MVDMNDPEVIESLKFLLVPKEEKIQTQARPFDGKKNVFVPDPKEGFVDAEIVKEDEAKGMVTVKTGKGEERTVKKADVQQMNPPKYEKCDDMADLTYLNDATVLHNLRTRYVSWYIYTYSGLFCVTINPFRRLPVYTMKMVHYYRGKKKNEVPPHLYLVADNAYASMMRDRENQSMLITGESGAGKTENTKKVIQYFAFVAMGVSGKKQSAEDANKPSLEDQIVSANPVMEAYGNAKTTRNNNSSRFGKFIRIHFTAQFGIAGADIESYLLEKSRITYQMPAERNYHIFYYICSKAFPDMCKTLFLEHDPGKYNFINQGMLTIDKVDDEAEMKDTKKAFDILLFTQEEQLDLFKITAAVMHWGNQKWKQKPREEQAEADGTEDITKVANLLGPDLDPFIAGLLKPRIKVGKEFVNKGQNQSQVTNACAALSKAAYARAFQWIVDKCNETLDVKTVKRAHFIGVLDIAGFETFEENGFEQLCINFTNERLQQFFNNFMFVLEQEEYAKEGIVWEMMSFGADLQATIDLIDKPMGIFSMLEEECVVPKGTDTTYKEKLYAQHLGKHSSFGKPKPKKSKYEAHFDLHHYAGTVSYSVTGWLDKNKDPINEFVAAMFKTQQKNKLLSFLFRDIGAEEPAGGKGGKKGSQTISANHREQLNKLMKTLNATHPHFVRCIIPNEIKTGAIIDAPLVMHQLHCNGVLEGIRICRKGFPSRIIYVEFIQRYSILDPVASKGATDAASAKKATDSILQSIKMDPELFRLGLTKVLFKAGVLGSLEEHRDAAIAAILTMLQSHVRCYLMKKNIKTLVEQKQAIGVLQRNVKSFLTLKTWPWWKLMTFVKPLLNNSKKEEERKAREAEEARLAAEAAAAKAAAEAAAEAEKQRIEEERKAAEAKFRAELEAKAREAEENTARLAKERADLQKQLEEEQEASSSAQAEVSKLTTLKNNLEKKVKELEGKLTDSEAQASDLGARKKKLEAELGDLKKSHSDVSSKLAKAEADIKSKDSQIQKLQADLAGQEDGNARLSKDKKQLEKQNADLSNNLEQETNKVNHLNKVVRKLEGDLKTLQSQKEEVESLKSNVEDQVRRKEAEVSSLNARISDEQTSSAAAQKKIRELQQQLRSVESSLEAETENRSRSEKQRVQVTAELGRLQQELEEAGAEKNAQNERKRQLEDDVSRLRRELEELRAQHTGDIADLRKKNQESLQKIGIQNEEIQRNKATFEKEKKSLLTRLDESNAKYEALVLQKSNSDKYAEKLDQRLKQANTKIDETAREISELNSQKSGLQSKIVSLARQKEEAEEIANQNLLKFRKAQNDVREANDRADEAEKLASKLRSERRTNF